MGSNEYKILLKKLIKFIIVLLVIDMTLGSIAKEVFFSQKTGKYARVTYLIKENCSDIIIMGSSHANRHYVPKLFKNELNKTCYNGGVQGQAIIFHLALQKMILKRYKPDTIILNIDRGWMYKSSKAYDGLADLHPYYWNYRAELNPLLSLNSKLVDFKLLFKAYQTNSTLVHAIKYFFSPQVDFLGYKPLIGKMKKPPPSKMESGSSVPTGDKTYVVDINFVNAYKEFIANTKTNNINLILVISPSLNNYDISDDNKSMKIMYQIASENSIPIIDFSKNADFIGQYQLFHDIGHLNDDGAKLFTQLLTGEIKKRAFKNIPSLNSYHTEN